MNHNQTYRFLRSAAQGLLGGIALAVLSLVCLRFQVNSTTATLLYLIVIVLVSLAGDFVASALVSIIALICLDYFFTPPLFSLAMSKPLDLVALIAFLTTAFVINHLISKARRSLQEIQALKDQSRLVIDTTPALIHSALPDGYLDYFNQRWLEYFGLSLEDVEGWRWTATIHPDDVAGIVDKWRSCLASGEIFEYETRVRRADGEYRWMLHRKVPRRDERGNIVKWYGSSIDIHERKRAEETLRRSEAYLAEAQTLSHTGSFAYDPVRRKTLFWSEELFRIFGLDPQRGVPDYNETRRLVHPDDLDRVSGECLQGFREKADFTQDYRLLLHDGTVKHLHVMWHPVLDKDGEVIEYVGTAADVTERKRAEQALRRSEALLAEGQRIGHTGSFGWNVASDEHFWSDETFRIFEYDTSTKITLQLILERIHPEDIPLVQQVIARAADGKDLDLEYRLLLPSGSVKYVHVVAHAVSDESSNIEFIGAVMDVTERKRAEETLRRSEAYLAEAQRLSHTGSFAYDPVSRESLYWSEEVFRICGLDPQRGIPDPDKAAQLVHPDDRDRTSGVVLKAFREKAEVTIEYRLLLHDRTIKHLHTIWHPVFDKDGELIEYVGTLADVTERKSAERALRRSEALLAEGQRISHTGSFGWNVSSGEIFWSEETFRIFEYDRATNPTVERVLQRVHPEDKALVQQLIDRASREGKGFDFEHRLLMVDGSVKHLHVVGHPITDESGSIEFIGAVFDVTERKQAEETLRRSQAELAHVTRVMTVGELMASIAHEINQPLAAVITNAAACLRWLATPIPNLDEAREAVARITRDGKRASDVIGRIRALVKKSGTEQVHLDINEVIQDVVGLLQSEIQKNGVVLRMELAGDLPQVLGDRVQLLQVIMNLVMNGIEAMSGVTDRSRGLLIRSRQHGVDKVLVAVQDSGIGVDRANVEKIFNAFYTTKSQGMGMGLAISRSIIENHGGQLWAVPNDGPGATFQFTLDVGIKEESKRIDEHSQ